MKTDLSGTQSRPPSGAMRVLVMAVQRLVFGFAARWLLMLNGFVALYLGGACLAPALMATGHPAAANAIYTLYGFACHQLPQRSYYLFGEAGAVLATYSLDTLVANGADPASDWTLRRFRGTPALGHKAAICQRDLSLYTGALAGGLLFGLARRRGRVRSVPFWLLILLAAPMVLDGGSHLVADLTGADFRATNAWAVTLTRGVFAPEFYTGTTIGSLDWLLRNASGFLFGFGIIWYAYPIIGQGFDEVLGERERLARKQQAPSPD